MQLSDPDAYYADRDVPHTAQGDIYAGIPFVHATLLTSAFEAAGARKRPDAREPDLGVVTSHEGSASSCTTRAASPPSPMAPRATPMSTG